MIAAILWGILALICWALLGLLRLGRRRRHNLGMSAEETDRPEDEITEELIALGLWDRDRHLRRRGQP